MHGITWHCSKLLGAGRNMQAAKNRRSLEVAAIARAMRLQAWVVSGPGEIQRAVQEDIASRGPCVIEVRVEPSIPPPLGERARSLAGFIED
jgi:thiamine pyrophosphate-dependent acetolactate synthase large subunit-like protein